ncbi:putative nuclease HARBI1 [Centropristis striata]|uniref:putative nuclease HARBI1 n=1 Tax=Centropristis striata TaxID=184440 RepID=UPI0027E1C83C|nr:putative nuclease HARBI1 [Centropristis striata]
MEPNLTRPTKRSHAIPAHLQVLSVLGFLATGTFQREIGDRSGISQPSMSRILPAVLRGIIKLMPEYIQFPYGAQRQTEVMQGFSAVANMPGVIGAIDCTHVRIKAPSGDAFAYINRKNFHSVNVQLICDAKCVLINVVARWPGGTHDAFILRNCAVGTRLEDGAVRDGWLIGDRGYPLTPWLMTPLASPQTPQELSHHY